MTERAILSVPLADIIVDEGPRPIDAEAVKRLSRSISEIGMHTPVVVTFERYDKDKRGRNNRPIYRIVTGRHRLAAARSLGWTEIETIRFEHNDAMPETADLDVLEEMWAIAENLHRAGLTKKQRDEQIRRYAELLAKRQEKPGQNVQVSVSGGRGNKSVATKIAEEVGLSAKTVKRALKPESDTDEKERRAAEQAKREAEQAEFDRQREEARENLSPEVKAAQARKDEAIAARKGRSDDAMAFLEAEVDELREANAALEAEIVALKADHAKWQDMRVQFEQGGFEKVVADKDEEIRVLLTRVATESEDKVSWMNKAKFWKNEAEKLGHGDDDIIPLTPKGAGNG